MYIQFNQTGEALGETFKLNEIRYETQGARLIAAGVATAVTDEEFAEQQWAVNNPEASMAAGSAGGVVNALSNGVLQDGSDQSSETQSLIASNRSVFFPKGVYTFSTHFTVNNVTNLKIYGEPGTVFRGATNRFLQLTGNLDNIEVSGISFESTVNSATNDAYGLLLVNNSGATTVMTNIRILDNQFTNELTKVNAIKVISEGASSLIDGLYIENNRFIKIGRFGIETQNHVGDGVARIKNFRINSNFLNDIGTIQGTEVTGAISVSGHCTDGQINYNTILDLRMNTTAFQYYGIENAGCVNLQTIGNLIRSTTYGFTGILGSDADDVPTVRYYNWTIANNIIDLHGTNTDKTRIVGIDIANLYNYTVMNNIVYADGICATFKNCDFGKISNNIFTNAEYYGLYFQTGCSGNEVFFNTVDRTPATSDYPCITFTGSGVTDNFIFGNKLLNHLGAVGAVTQESGATNNTRFTATGEPTRFYSASDPSLIASHGTAGETRIGGRSISAYNGAGALSNLDISALTTVLSGALQATTNVQAATMSIGLSAPSSKAVMEMSSTTKGILIPRMTTTQKNAITTPGEGNMVFDLSLHKLCIYNGSAWETITSAP